MKRIFLLKLVLTSLFLYPLSSFAGGINVLSLIGLLADVKSLTTGLTINQTAADAYCSVTVLGITTEDNPPPDTGIFSAGSQCDLTVGAASAKANAEATIGAWEPFSSSGTVLTAQPTKATATLINNNPASAVAAATAAINGRVTSKKDIQPPPVAPGGTLPQSETVSVLFALQFGNIEAEINGEVVTFQYGIDFSNGSIHKDIIFAKGTIGGSGNVIELPYMELLNPDLASLLRQQFLDIFKPNNYGIINVNSYLFGEGILPSRPDGAVGFEFNTTLDEEYIVSGNLTSIDTASVPEPTTIFLLISGLVWIKILRWRNTQAA